jgi:hypothetical protein
MDRQDTGACGYFHDFSDLWPGTPNLTRKDGSAFEDQFIRGIDEGKNQK